MSEDGIKEHYLRHGRAEGYMYKRYCTVVLYQNHEGLGLINQFYTHLTSIMLAKALGAELVLPSAIYRDEFVRSTGWHSGPAANLIDVEAITNYWSDKGVFIHSLPNKTDLEENDPRPTLQLQRDEELPLDLRSHVYQHLGRPGRRYSETVDVIRQAIVSQTEARLRLQPDVEIPYLVVQLGDTFCSFESFRGDVLLLVAEVARSLRFAPHLVQLADQVVHIVTDGGKRAFNGLHLRIEADASEWLEKIGGVQGAWAAYIAAMRNATFSAESPVYIASGLTAEGDMGAFNESVRVLVDNGLSSAEVHYKEKHLEKALLSGLNSEERAAIDFLVLARCRAFVGFGASTFSLYLPQYRILNGYPAAPCAFVGFTDDKAKKCFTIAAIGNAPIF